MNINYGTIKVPKYYKVVDAPKDHFFYDCDGADNTIIKAWEVQTKDGQPIGCFGVYAVEWDENEKPIGFEFETVHYRTDIGHECIETAQDALNDVIEH